MRAWGVTLPPDKVFLSRAQFKMAFDDAKIDLQAGAKQRMAGRYRAAVQFQREFLLIYSGRRKQRRLHAPLEPVR